MCEVFTLDSCLELKSKGVKVLETVPTEEKIIKAGYTRCIDCIHGKPEIFDERLNVQKFKERVDKKNKSILGSGSIPPRVANCNFSRCLVKCEFDKADEYRSPGSTCKQAELKNVTEARNLEEEKLEQYMNTARRISNHG